MTGGEDWFEAVVYLRWDRDRLDALATQLDGIKEAAAEGEGDGWTQSLPGSAGLWKVEPHGCRLGQGGKGPIMRWRLSRDGIEFQLTKRPEPHKTLPSGLVRMRGETLIAFGDARALWDQVLVWFAELGAVVETAKLSRVDMCVDLPGIAVSEFVVPYQDGRYTTRTKRAREYARGLPEGEDAGDDPEDASASMEVYRSGRKYTGLRFGVGTKLRIYDKLAECRDLAKRAWLAHRRWGGMPDEATRVEFQLNRSFLKAEKLKPGRDGLLGRPVIDTVEDYFRFRAELAAYLCSEWVRFFEEGFDARHPERGSTLAVWDRVAKDFQAWAGGDPRSSRYIPIKREQVSVDDLVRQAKGCLESAAARAGLWVEQPDDLYYFANEQMSTAIDDDGAQVCHRVHCKMKSLIAPVGAAPAPF